MSVFHKNKVSFNTVHFEIEFCDSGFSCLKWIQRVLQSMPQKF